MNISIQSLYIYQVEVNSPLTRNRRGQAALASVVSVERCV